MSSTSDSKSECDINYQILDIPANEIYAAENNDWVYNEGNGMDEMEKHLG